MKWSVMHRATGMRSEVLRLSTFRRSHGEVLDVDVWGRAIAAVLDREPRGQYLLGYYRRIWPGLDALTLADAMRQLGFKAYDMDELFASVARRRGRKITAAELGRLLRLMAVERDELRIRNIDAHDQTRDERIAAAKQRKTNKDRCRWKTKRAEYEEKSFMKTKPWESEGISRTAWYLNRQTAEHRADLKHRKRERDRSRWKTHHEDSLIRTKPWEAEGISRSSWYRGHSAPRSGVPCPVCARKPVEVIPDTCADLSEQNRLKYKVRQVRDDRSASHKSLSIGRNADMSANLSQYQRPKRGQPRKSLWGVSGKRQTATHRRG